MKRSIYPTVHSIIAPSGQQTVYSVRQGGEYRPRKFRTPEAGNLMPTPVLA